MPSKCKPTPTECLMAAMDRCATARGEAQWTNGYRAGAQSDFDVDGLRLHGKEMEQWQGVERAEAAFRRLAQRLTRGSR